MLSTVQSNCPVKCVKRLIQVLNPVEETLFQRPKRKFCSADEIWFDRAPLGVNTLGNMIKEISIAAIVSQICTNHCIRDTSVTKLDRAGIPVPRIMQVSGHTNEGSVTVYCERQILQQQWQCSEILTKQTEVSTTDHLVLARKPLQKTHNTNKNEIRYQSSFSNTTSQKFVDFGQARFENCKFTFNYNTAKEN